MSEVRKSLRWLTIVVFFNLEQVLFAVKLSGMGVTVELHNTGNPSDQAEIVAAIEHTLAGNKGDWRVTIVGSQLNDCWDMKIEGPNGFERSYTLEGSAGEHEPNVIRARLARLLPLRTGAMRRS